MSRTLLINGEPHQLYGHVELVLMHTSRLEEAEPVVGVFTGDGPFYLDNTDKLEFTDEVR